VNEPIAIVGLACVYPDAHSPKILWENVLARRRAFRRLPAERLRLEDYHDPNPAAPDKTYATQAAVIEGYEFNRVKFRVMGSTYRSADLAHWLALDVAAQSLEDAGFGAGEGLPRESTGVVLGNTLTGEFSRANVMRLRWPYVRRVLDSVLAEQTWTEDQRKAFLNEVEARYKSPFPPVGEETLAGGLSNTIAGRICNQFDLKGGGYTVDGACAASLLAVAQGCSALASGDLDVVLAGGVDLSLDPFELVGFAKTGALAPERMRIYDARSAGFWPGEGCGFVVLMRYEDAIAQSRRVYAMVRGWGVSSDGSGGITRPETEGQLQALKRAYRKAGFGIDTISYFEGHGTGTRVGDQTELKTLSRARREANPGAPAAVIGSIKANIGHTKAAAGLAGLIKASLALHHQVLPPTTGCEQPDQELTGPEPALRPLEEAEPWPVERPLRAAVSAMGFGGINAHLVLEGTQAQRRRRLSPRELELSGTPQDAELFLLEAPNHQALRHRVDGLLRFAFQLSQAELTDLAATLSRNAGAGASRAAIVAGSPAELSERLAVLKKWLEVGTQTRTDPDQEVFLGESNAGTPPGARIGFLFPGQGSPVYVDGGIYRRRFSFLRELYENRIWNATGDGSSTRVAQPAIVTATLAGLRLLQRLGIQADVAVGHSLGELAALHWAGAYDEASLIRMAAVRGHAMSELGDPTGCMAAIGASELEVERLIAGVPVVLSGFNAPAQTVISGPAEAVATITARARARGWRTVPLPVSHAFHTDLVAGAVPVWREHLQTVPMNPLERPVASTVSGTLLPLREDLRELLSRQITSPVRFLEAFKQARGALRSDLKKEAPGRSCWIEVGPGQVLSGLTAEIEAEHSTGTNGESSPLILALDAGGSSLRGLLRVAGWAFGAGLNPRHQLLFEGRLHRPFPLDWRPKFFRSPCELATENESGPTFTDAAKPDPIPETTRTEPDPIVSERMESADGPLEVVRQLVAARSELPLTAIQDDHRMLSDLHLNSITVGQLVGEAVRKLNLPPMTGLTEFANATVGEVAGALEELSRNGDSPRGRSELKFPAGIDSWVRPFRIEWIVRPLPSRTSKVEPRRPGNNGNGKSAGLHALAAEKPPRDWRIIAPPDHPLGADLKEVLSSIAGGGVVVCLPAAPLEPPVDLLLEGARAVWARQEPKRFVLVQHQAVAGSFARTLHLETPDLTTCVIEVPAGHVRAAQWVGDEIAAATGYVESSYDPDGTRREPRLKLLEPWDNAGAPATNGLPATLGPEDVLLVTGGGKGIAAECALALGRKAGLRLVLLGRSDPATDPELASNLERIAATGISCRYFSADVADAAAVTSAIRKAEREFGPITALLHGAGVNRPKLIQSLDAEAFRQTMAPKVSGLRHVLEAVDPDRLKALITFGSIIARLGLQGEADYAVANEWQTRMTEEFQAAHPNCRCLALEWSVWSGLGMGQRLGRIDTLLRHGITPIPPDVGIAWLLRLSDHPSPPVAVLVTGRFGNPPTLGLEKPDLPLRRFLEQPRIHYPGLELVADVTLSAENDPYVEDHVYHGERLFPAVMGLEAMAQVAMALTGASRPPDFEDVSFSRPVVVPRQGRRTARVAALVREPGVVEVALRSEETGFQADHFHAVCRWPDPATGWTSLAASLREGLRLDAIPPPLALNPETHLYRDLLFHSGRFLRVKNYRLLRAKECLVEVESDSEVRWFGSYFPQDRVLGDAGVRDAAIHAIQACIPHARLLPVGVGRVRVGPLPCLPGNRAANGKKPNLFLSAREQYRNGDLFHYDLALLDENGRILEQWEDLRLRKVEPLTRRTPWPEPLLGPYLERRLEELFPGNYLRVEWESDPSRPSRSRSDDALQRAQGLDLRIRRRPDGKPEGAPGLSVSASHCQACTLAVAAPTAVACDLESVCHREEADWKSLLGTERWELANIIARETPEREDASATRLWVAMECVKKAELAPDTPVLWKESLPDGWVLFQCGAHTLATALLQVDGNDGPVLAGFLAGKMEPVRPASIHVH
jgi:enediyne polyketide synthase